jgi:hypothetical protein
VACLHTACTKRLTDGDLRGQEANQAYAGDAEGKGNQQRRVVGPHGESGYRLALAWPTTGTLGPGRDNWRPSRSWPKKRHALDAIAEAFTAAVRDNSYAAGGREAAEPESDGDVVIGAAWVDVDDARVATSALTLIGAASSFRAR